MRIGDGIKRAVVVGEEDAIELGEGLVCGVGGDFSEGVFSLFCRADVFDNCGEVFLIVFQGTLFGER